MTVLPFRRGRTLAHVLLDIEEADRRWSNHQGAEIESELLDHLDALRCEARDMLEAATGISWASIESARL